MKNINPRRIKALVEALGPAGGTITLPDGTVITSNFRGVIRPVPSPDDGPGAPGTQDDVGPNDAGFDVPQDDVDAEAHELEGILTDASQLRRFYASGLHRDDDKMTKLRAALAVKNSRER